MTRAEQGRLLRMLATRNVVNPRKYGVQLMLHKKIKAEKHDPVAAGAKPKNMAFFSLAAWSKQSYSWMHSIIISHHHV